jgi:hypothetical protein
MKRSTVMLVILRILVCPSIPHAHGCGSQFVRVTPETQDEYGLYVQILPVDGSSDKVQIVLPAVYESMTAHLIVCRDRVPAVKQDFRFAVWSLNRPQSAHLYGRPSDGERPEILSIAPLRLPIRPHKAVSNRVFGSRTATVLLDRHLFDRSYIYIDYATPVADGGDYYCIDLSTYPLPEEYAVEVHYSPAVGLGPESGVMRRDPSDIIRTRKISYDFERVRIVDTYYCWYTKSHVSHGYDATIWYATSTDGRVWEEKGEALPRGPEGGWDAQSVFTPNILVAEDRYWLFYTGVPKPFNNKGNKVTKSAIGIAVAESPDGPWAKLSTNPALRCSGRVLDFDSMRVDDACLIVRDGKYWLYYKGRRWDRTPAQTKMGVAIADKPEGPYVKCAANPVIDGGHEVLVWPLGTGVAAMVNIGPKGIGRTLQYAPDGLTFSKMQGLAEVPHAPGAYRPQAFRDKGKGRMIDWGIHIGRKKGSLPFLERFDCQWGPRVTHSDSAVTQ